MREGFKNRVLYEDRYGIVIDQSGKRQRSFVSDEFTAENRQNPKTKTEKTLASHWKRFGTKAM